MKFKSAFLALIFVSLWASLARAQNPLPEQLQKARDRSDKSAQVIKTLAELTARERGIPREMWDKARAVAVFPHVVKATLLFQQSVLGQGVIAQRQAAGWSLPAYYTFGGGGLEAGLASGDSLDVIMLFMNDTAAGWFQKGRLLLKDEKRAVGGPLGRMPSEPPQAIRDANIILYTLKNGALESLTVSSGFWQAFQLQPDNKLNKAIYGIKSNQTLSSSKPPTVKDVPTGINKFQEALQTELAAAK